MTLIGPAAPTPVAVTLAGWSGWVHVRWLHGTLSGRLPWRSLLAQSTTEAEYIAAASMANEIVWWKRLCDDLGYEVGGPVTIWCDNRGATLLAEHEGNFEATKHIQLRYHILRDYQNRDILRVRWRKSGEMWADVLTKNCCYPHFSRVVSKLLGEDLPPVRSSGGRSRV